MSDVCEGEETQSESMSDYDDAGLGMASAVSPVQKMEDYQAVGEAARHYPVFRFCLFAGRFLPAALARLHFAFERADLEIWRDFAVAYDEVLVIWIGSVIVSGLKIARHLFDVCVLQTVPFSAIAEEELFERDLRSGE